MKKFDSFILTIKVENFIDVRWTSLDPAYLSSYLRQRLHTCLQLFFHFRKFGHLLQLLLRQFQFLLNCRYFFLMQLKSWKKSFFLKMKKAIKFSLIDDIIDKYTFSCASLCRNSCSNFSFKSCSDVDSLWAFKYRFSSVAIRSSWNAYVFSISRNRSFYSSSIEMHQIKKSNKTTQKIEKFILDNYKNIYFRNERPTLILSPYYEWDLTP